MKSGTHNFSKTSSKFKTMQPVGAEFYGQDYNKISQLQDNEPKSKKLLEMMLKRISKLNIEATPQPVETSDSSPYQAGTTQGLRFMAAPRQSIEIKPSFENKSVSMDHNKKKVHITMNRDQDSSHNSRRSSRDST